MMLLLSLIASGIAEAVSPDRPTVSMSAQVLDRAYGQIEAGVLGLGDLNESVFGGSVLISYGIGDDFEIRMDSFIDQHGQNLHLSPGVKWTAPSILPQAKLGLALHPVLPIGRDFSIHASVLSDLKWHALSMSINAGGLIEMADQTTFSPQVSAVLGYPIHHIAPFLEVIGRLNTEFETLFGGGFLWSNSQYAFDMAAFYTPPSNSLSPHYQVTLGWTYRFRGE